MHSHLSCFLLKFLNGSLVDSAAFIDQMAGGGGFPGVDVTDHNDVDVGFFFAHVGGLLWRNTGCYIVLLNGSTSLTLSMINTMRSKHTRASFDENKQTCHLC